jgi:chromosome segregation ATPase
MEEPSDDSGADCRAASELRAANQRLQSENARFARELAAANESTARATETVRKLQAECAVLKQENDDLASRLAIADRLRADSAAAAATAQQEDRLLRLNEIDELEGHLTAANQKKQALEAELSATRKRLDQTVSELTSIKSQTAALLKLASQAFNEKFEFLDIFSAFIAARPHFDAQRELEAARLKSQEQIQKKRYRSQKAALRSARIEIERLERNVADLESSFRDQNNALKVQLTEKSKELKSLRKSHERELSRIETQARNAELLRTRKTRLFVYRAPTINIATPVPVGPALVDKLRDKLKLRSVEIRDLQQRNDSLSTDKAILTQRVGDLELDIRSLNVQLTAAQTQNSEAAKQLTFLRSTLDHSKEKSLTRKLKSERQRVESAEQALANQRQQVHDLGVSLQNAQEKNRLLANEIQDLRSQLESPAVIERREPPDPISFINCAVSGFPKGLESEARRILNSPDLQNSSKVKALVGLLCSFYEKQLATISSELTEKNLEFTAVFADFIPSLTLLFLKRSISLEAFMSDPQSKHKLLSAMRLVCNSAASVPQIQTELQGVMNTNQALTSKLHKCKRKLRNQNAPEGLIRCSGEMQSLQDRIEELEGMVRGLTNERNRLEQALEAQRAEYLEKLQAAKSGSLGGYEEIVAQLKHTCAEQRETIRSLSRQIGANASL